MSDPRETSDTTAVVVGVLADPEAAPAEIARHLSRTLPGALDRYLETDRGWEVRVRRERLPAGDQGHDAMVSVARERLVDEGWDVAVCVTDLPLRSGEQPLVADLSREHRVAVISLPGLGGMRLRRRVEGIVVHLVAELRGEDTGIARPDGGAPGGVSRKLRLVEPDDEDIDVRLVASRGRARLLVGMVRANRPWRLVFGLTGALVAAFAFGLFWLANGIVWELADSLGAWRLLTIMVVAVGAMVAWLILDHGLWERTSSDEQTDRVQIALFNASTLLTLLVGVSFMYAGLFVVNLAGTALLVTTEVLREHVGIAGPSLYATIAWVATSLATVAGALGSGFESDESVREAAYSYREQERRRGDTSVPDTSDEE
jgi:hypothetical protein